VLDCDGVSKMAEGDIRALSRFAQTRRQRGRVVVSAATLAEVLRGNARDAKVHRILNQVTVVDLSRDLGRSAGELLGSSGLPADAAIDAMVAATAIAEEGRPAMILTSDPKDLAALTEGNPGIGVERV
jgi:predicted nucleic acid-binding protein